MTNQISGSASQAPSAVDRQHAACLVENLIDEEIVVDDRRADVDRAVAELEGAVSRRDTTARELKVLLARLARA